MSEAWDRQDNETLKSWTAWQVYRGLLPKERSARKVADALGYAGERHVEGWSSKYKWVERAKAWDRNQAALIQEEEEHESRKMAKRHTQIAMGLLGRVAQAIQEFDPKHASPTAISSMLKVATDLERTSRGILVGVKEIEAAVEEVREQGDLERWRDVYVAPEGTFIPHKVQRLAIQCDARYEVVVAGAQGGKLLAPDAPVRTPTGWARIDSLKPGDTVIGGTGQPCRVLGVYPSPGPHEFKRLVFDDGAQVEACVDHLWRVQDREARSRRVSSRYGTWGVMSTQEILDRWGPEPKSCNRVMIPTACCYGEERLLTVLPYLMGALLADGGLTGTTVKYSKVDPQTIGRVRREVEHEGCELITQKNGKDHRVRNPLIRHRLADMGLVGKRSWEKSIPRAYLDSSIEQRTDLLHGLMDGDGTCGKPSRSSTGGHSTYTTTSPQLRDDVVELIRSLGGKAKWVTRHTHFTYKGERRPGRESYRISVRVTFCPFWTKAKASLWSRPDGSRGKSTRRGTPDGRLLYRIEDAPPGPGVCIEVDDPTRTYVTRDYVVTHNTSGAAVNYWRRIMDERKALAAKGDRGFYWMVAPNSIVGEVMCEAFVQFAPPGEIVSSKGQPGARIWTLRDGSRVQFRSGEHADKLVARRVHGAWLDEFTVMKPEVWTVSVRQRLSTTSGWALFSGTPRGRNWAWEEIWRRAQPGDDKYDEDYTSFTWHSAANPMISDAEVEAARRQLPPAYFKREWEAAWEAFHGQVYESWDRGLMLVPDLARTPAKGAVYYMGVDWGFAAPGALVVARRTPRGDWEIVDEVQQAGKLQEWWLGEIAKRWRRWHVQTVWCDPADPGRIAGLCSEGIPARAATNDVLPGIRTVASLMTQGRLLVDATCDVLAGQLGDYRWKQDTRGNRQEAPVKESDHACLAPWTRINVRGRGWVRLDEAQEPGEVWTPSGWRAFSGAQVTRRVAEVVRVTFADGFVLTATPDHRVRDAEWRWAESGSLAKGSLLAWTRGPHQGQACGVASVEPAGTVDVWCIAVPGEGQFLAENGVTLANCDAARYLLHSTELASAADKPRGGVFSYGGSRIEPPERVR